MGLPTVRLHLRLTLCLLTLLALLAPGRAVAARRLAVLVGANIGWNQDQALRHAEDDARRLGAVLSELGDFPADSLIFLNEPTTEQLRATLDDAARKLAGSGEEGFFVFYYSGHADEQHLHLKGRPLSFEELYARLREVPAAVKLGILDACKSGSILAAKGGRPAATFEVTVQAEKTVRGTVILTSSGADELSQEARAISGSFFSHHLVSGLRGAADEDNDLRVSLHEAYRYAFSRTLVDTAATPTGAQRPAFRNELKGHGELYLTRMHGPGPVAFLEFPRDGRRCFVTDIAERRLVAELFPQQKQGARLALPAGSHLLKCTQDKTLLVTPLAVRSGERVDITRLEFREVPLSEGVLKGGARSQDPVEQLKRQGFMALRNGQPEEALPLFDQAIQRDRRDREAFRGKAQAYLVLADRAHNPTEREYLVATAVRTDPRIEEAPEFIRQPIVLLAARPEELKRSEGQRFIPPRSLQLWGYGGALFAPGGFLAASLDLMLTERLHISVEVPLVPLGIGPHLRFVPKDTAWSHFIGVGANVSAVALLGLSREPGEAGTAGRLVALANFDRLVYVDAGWQWVGEHFHWELGVALGYSRPLGGGGALVLMPVLSLKYFFRGRGSP